MSSFELDNIFIMKNEKNIASLIYGRHLAQNGKGRFLREAAGFSIQEMAQLLGVQPLTLRRWESGETRRPHGSSAIRWADICRVIEEGLRELDRVGESV